MIMETRTENRNRIRHHLPMIKDEALAQHQCSDFLESKKYLKKKKENQLLLIIIYQFGVESEHRAC